MYFERYYYVIFKISVDSFILVFILVARQVILTMRRGPVCVGSEVLLVAWSECLVMTVKAL